MITFVRQICQVAHNAFMSFQGDWWFFAARRYLKVQQNDIQQFPCTAHILYIVVGAVRFKASRRWDHRPGSALLSPEAFGQAAETFCGVGFSGIYALLHIISKIPQLTRLTRVAF